MRTAKGASLRSSTFPLGTSPPVSNSWPSTTSNYEGQGEGVAGASPLLPADPLPLPLSKPAVQSPDGNHRGKTSSPVHLDPGVVQHGNGGADRVGADDRARGSPGRGRRRGADPADLGGAAGEDAGQLHEA